ncbi:GTPase IMAP family member 9-like isoform X1 [Leuresthes tenuis]|uniref:GTPase IMAP family member 9-like isoform X1 n=1 Tax=Leuresthes tenuis TaxID=355514 RepID=UPI003B5021E8
MECRCDENNSDDAVAGWWLGGNNAQMGAFAIVGYLLYRFSQTLPALIRWPIRLFCSLTGLSALWGWVSHLVRTLRGIKSLFKWLSRIWQFIVGECRLPYYGCCLFFTVCCKRTQGSVTISVTMLHNETLIYKSVLLTSNLLLLQGISSRFKWLVAIIKAVTGSPGEGSSSQTDVTNASIQKLICDLSSSCAPKKPGLRLILLGPSGGGRTSLAETLLGDSGSLGIPKDPLMQSTKQRTVRDDRELTVVDTPDVLGTSLESNQRAREALRSLQLTSPGPHAFLLVIRAPGSSMGIDQDAFQAVQATLELFGEGVLGYIIPVLTHADRLRRQHTVDELLKKNAGNLNKVTSLCGQRPELVDSRSDLPPKEQGLLCSQLLGRVTQMKGARGHFVHELQKKEDHLREELLTDMSAALARKLGHM